MKINAVELSSPQILLFQHSFPKVEHIATEVLNHYWYQSRDVLALESGLKIPLQCIHTAPSNTTNYILLANSWLEKVADTLVLWDLIGLGQLIHHVWALKYQHERLERPSIYVDGGIAASRITNVDGTGMWKHASKRAGAESYTSK